MSSKIFEKRGLVYCPRGQHEWNKTHASVPTVDILSKTRWRIYFATRDAQNHSHPTYIEVDSSDPRKILYEHDKPILGLGKPGSFDDSGIMPSWVVTYQGRKFLYYIGWTIGDVTPYRNAIGLAVSEDGGETFHKIPENPIFGLTREEPYFTGTSCVLIDKGVWKNWYLSATGWSTVNGCMEPRYHLKYAQSKNGIDWERKGTVAIDYLNEEEGGLARASVLHNGGLYQMWFSYRKLQKYRTSPEASYRIGYAQSEDGVHWKRRDCDSGIDISREGWDSEMIEYPHVISSSEGLVMFYNGNGFGRSGLGYAVSRFLPVSQ